MYEGDINELAYKYGITLTGNKVKVLKYKDSLLCIIRRMTDGVWKFQNYRNVVEITNRLSKEELEQKLLEEIKINEINRTRINRLWVYSLFELGYGSSRVQEGELKLLTEGGESVSVLVYDEYNYLVKIGRNRKIVNEMELKDLLEEMNEEVV